MQSLTMSQHNTVLTDLGSETGLILNFAAGHYEIGWRSGCSSCAEWVPSSGLTHWQGWRVPGRQCPPLSPALPPAHSHSAPMKGDTMPYIRRTVCEYSLTLKLLRVHGQCRRFWEHSILYTIQKLLLKTQNLRMHTYFVANCWFMRSWFSTCHFKTALPLCIYLKLKGSNDVVVKLMGQLLSYFAPCQHRRLTFCLSCAIKATQRYFCLHQVWTACAAKCGERDLERILCNGRDNGAPAHFGETSD